MVHEQYHPKLLAIAPMRITIRHGFSPRQDGWTKSGLEIDASPTTEKTDKPANGPQVPSWVA